MKKLLLLFCLLSVLFGYTQTDVMMLEKKGDRIKTFGAGTDITMETIYGQWFDGTITAIRNDSIFINGLAFHYKEITAIRTERKKLNYQADGTLLLAAGGGVLVLGAVNGLIRHDQPKDWYKPASYITAGSLLLLGFLIKRSQFQEFHLGKKYKLEYLALGVNKK